MKKAFYLTMAAMMLTTVMTSSCNEDPVLNEKFPTVVHQQDTVFNTQPDMISTTLPNSNNNLKTK